MLCTLPTHSRVRQGIIFGLTLGRIYFQCSTDAFSYNTESAGYKAGAARAYTRRSTGENLRRARSASIEKRDTARADAKLHNLIGVHNCRPILTSDTSKLAQSGCRSNALKKLRKKKLFFHFLTILKKKIFAKIIIKIFNLQTFLHLQAILMKSTNQIEAL